MDWQYIVECMHILSTHTFSNVTSSTDCSSLCKVKSAHVSRIKFGDISTKDTLDQLTPDIERLPQKNAKWHKLCYATFTSQQHINQLEARQKMQETPLLQAVESTSHAIPLTTTSLPGVDWKLCIFCQRRTRQIYTKSCRIQLTTVF